MDIATNISLMRLGFWITVFIGLAFLLWVVIGRKIKLKRHNNGSDR